MNLIYNLMGDKDSEMTEKLVSAGIGPDQAERFLPDALKGIIDGLQQLDIGTLLDSDSGTQTSSLMEKIDINAIAGHLGGDNRLASNGLQAIIPQVLGFLKNNPAAASLLSGSDASGMMGMAKGLFH